VATTVSTRNLVQHGLQTQQKVHCNLSTALLVEHAVRRGEGQLSADGAFVAITKPHTGRSPDDKFVVREPSCEQHIGWGKSNVPMSPEHFAALHDHVRASLAANELFVSDLFAGADESYRLNVRLISTSAWHSLFARNMFIPPGSDELADFEPGFTILHAPELQADPARHGTRSGTFIVLNFAEKLVLIGGTRYAGEIKSILVC
jgi:phosphoenolpyruvate carboxykinase (ATP)